MVDKANYPVYPFIKGIADKRLCPRVLVIIATFGVRTKVLKLLFILGGDYFFVVFFIKIKFMITKMIIKIS